MNKLILLSSLLDAVGLDWGLRGVPRQGEQSRSGVVRAALMKYAENCRFVSSRPDVGYLKAVGLAVPRVDEDR